MNEEDDFMEAGQDPYKQTKSSEYKVKAKRAPKLSEIAKENEAIFRNCQYKTTEGVTVKLTTLKKRL